jgi:hypothetical protein
MNEILALIKTFADMPATHLLSLVSMSIVALSMVAIIVVYLIAKERR